MGQFEAVVRPKGLGLGATASTTQPTKPPAEGEEQLQMAPGAYVLVTIGKEKGGYGQVSQPAAHLSGSAWDLVRDLANCSGLFLSLLCEAAQVFSQ